jgi:hypothetical protein
MVRSVRLGTGWTKAGAAILQKLTNEEGNSRKQEVFCEQQPLDLDDAQ